MKTPFKYSLLCTAIVLAGCGDDSDISGIDSSAPFEDAINQSLARDSSINFILSGSDADVPLPSYLLFNTNDHTLELPLDANSNGELNDPLVAMGESDGWSTMMPFSINLSLPTNVTLKNDQLTLLSGVKLAKVTMDLATGVMSDFSALTAGVDYLVVASDDLKSINVVPLRGLDPSSDYIYALTDDLLDSNDEPLGMSRSYAMLKTKTSTQQGDLETPQKLTHQMEALFAGFGEVTSSEKIIYSSWFTTASAGEVLKGAKTAMAFSLDPNVTPAGVWKGSANPNGLDSTTINSMYTISANDTSQDFGTAVTSDTIFLDEFGSDTATQLQTSYNQVIGSGALDSIDVYRGTVNLPYFLSDDVDGDWKTTPWRSGMPSVFKIINVLSSGSDTDKASLVGQLATLGFSTDPNQIIDQLQNPQYQALLVGTQLTLADGSQLDADRILTRYSAVPQLRSVKSVPFVMFVPKRADFASLEVLQYQHGITNVKESAYLFALQHMVGAVQAGQQPYAVIAIDQPLHGERALSSDIVTTPENPTVFMNLEYLPVARDNIRQGAIDGLGLRLALNNADTNQGAFTTIDTSNVSLLGHSIGAITGIGSYSVSNLPFSPSVDGLFSYKTATFANPGGGIAPFLLESGSYSPIIKHSVVVAAVPQYQQHYASTCVPADISGGDCFTAFYDALDDSNPEQAALIAGIDGGLASFAYAAQTVLDNVDPYNIAPTLTGSILGIQSDGDSTIPNSVASNPSAGTEPLLNQMQLVNSALDATGNQLASYFDSNSGAEHSTLIAPATAAEVAANTEMTSQVMQFTLSGGNILVDDSLLDASK